MKYMDKLFNVGSSTDSVDSAVNYAKYTDELTELAAASNETAAQLAKMAANPGSLDTGEKARNSQYSNAEYIPGVAKSNL